MNWILIAILVVIVLVILKFKEIRHKFGFLIILMLLLFFVITAANVYRANKVDLKTFEGVVTAGKVYLTWLGGVFQNVKGISGYAVKQDWGLNNSENSEK